METTRTSSRPGPGRQRGAALLMAMIIVTLIATLASGMVWQQWRSVQVEAAERARVQSAWVLGGALDWARLILRESVRSAQPTGQVDALTQAWATPLAEARLSTFLAADKDNTDDGPEAFLSGTITDAQSRFNLFNLVTQNGKPNTEQLRVLQTLCETIGLSGQVATLIANGMAAASSTTQNSAAPLLPQSVDQLTWFGVDRDSLAALAPFVVVLPAATQINVNTAPREVLAALLGGDLGTAERLVQLRQRGPFKTPTDFTDQIQGTPPAADQFALSTSYFEIRGRLRLEDHVLEQRSLVQRAANGQVTVLYTQRVASTDPLHP